jgi:hypothetical protein
MPNGLFLSIFLIPSSVLNILNLERRNCPYDACVTRPSVI